MKKNVNTSVTTTAAAISARQVACEKVIKSGVTLNGCLYAEIPLDLIRVDVCYQREIGGARWPRINAMAAGWDANKANSVLVSYRTDTQYFFVLDGQGRFVAAQKAGLKKITCQILQNLELKDEAEAFLTQDDNMTKISMHDKCKAGVIAEHKDCITLVNTLARYQIDMKEVNGIGTAMEISAKNPTEIDWIFGLIVRTGWYGLHNCFSRTTLKSLHELYNKDFGKMDRIENVLVPIMTANRPDTFRNVSELVFTKSNKQGYLAMYQLYTNMIVANRDTRMKFLEKIAGMGIKVPAIAKQAE